MLWGTDGFAGSSLENPGEAVLTWWVVVVGAPFISAFGQEIGRSEPSGSPLEFEERPAGPNDRSKFDPAQESPTPP